MGWIIRIFDGFHLYYMTNKYHKAKSHHECRECNFFIFSLFKEQEELFLWRIKLHVVSVREGYFRASGHKIMVYIQNSVVMYL